MKTCDWCLENFEPKVAYQIYCSSSCREASTKEKVNERYQKNRRKKLYGKERRCSNGCGTNLSIYNTNGICSSCEVNNKKVERALKELKGIVDYERFD